jgi:Beta-propeller repeat
MKLKPLWLLLLCSIAMAPAEIQTQRALHKGDSNSDPARKAPLRSPVIQTSAQGLLMPQFVAPPAMESRAIPPSKGAGSTSVPRGNVPVGIRKVQPDRDTPRRLTPAAPLKGGLSRQPETSQPQLSAYGKLPLSFEANQGQADPKVKFLSRGNDHTLFLTSTEAVLTMRIAERGEKKSDSPVQTPQPELPNPQSTVLRMKLEGANPNLQVEGVDPLPGKSNYFLGSDPKKWRTNIPNYARVRYRNVYPGVDLVYYGNQRQLEYDLVVAPGADPSVIHLAFEGTEKLQVDTQGDLVLHVAGIEMGQHKPQVYQRVAGLRKAVPSRYIIGGGNHVSFQVGEYDTSQPLVIDPVLVYSFQLGGSQGGDYVGGVAVDSVGNAYIIGRTSSADFPVTPSALQSAYKGGTCGELLHFPCTDIFVSKISPLGNSLVYSTYLGGSLGEINGGIAVDSQGNAYLTGATNSSDFPTTQGALQTAIGGGACELGVVPCSDAFLSKISPQGNTLLYSTYLGGNSDDSGSGIALDTTGNVNLTGRTDSTNFPTANPVQAENQGGTDSNFGFDAFITKFNATGTALVYSTYLGGDYDDSGSSIAVDSLGDAYVTGRTESPNFPVLNPFQPGSGGHADAFVVKLNAEGTAFLYASYLGGSSDDSGSGIALASSGNAYVTGNTSSNDFPRVNPLQANSTGYDVFIAKISDQPTS